MSRHCAEFLAEFDSAHYQTRIQSVSAVLMSTSVFTTYWPHFAIGGGIIVVILLLGLFYCCYLKWKTSQVKRTYRRELIALTRGHVHSAPSGVSHV
uniref:FAST protein n=1 Tax=Kasama virus TaxID=2755161 RepID=A0A7D5Y283_9REOV|nr:FAST protein [Kasama virus]